jgi:hypothetical protein
MTEGEVHAMHVYEFQLMTPRSGELLGHARWDELYEALKARLPLNDLRYQGKPGTGPVDQGVWRGEPPTVELVTLYLSSPRVLETVRTALMEALAELGRPDLEVVHA